MEQSFVRVVESDRLTLITLMQMLRMAAVVLAEMRWIQHWLW